MANVHILTHSYLDGYNHDTSRIFGGGLERYLYDLSQLLLDMGHAPLIHQLSYFGDFETIHEAVTVRGYTFDLENVPEAIVRIAEQTDGPLIYASFIWQPIAYKPGSLGICHGLNWDRHDLELEQKQYVQVSIQNALRQLQCIVSVDSHFLSYARAVCHYEEAEQIVLLPNAVDTTYFLPAEKKRQDDQIRVLFPRRLSHERGIIPMMLATDALLAQFPHVEVEFAGELIKGTPIGEGFAVWRQHHPHRERILHNTYSFDQVLSAYQAADIAVVPSIFSEGTSYAALEALSCGLPVVSSNVGGLNDLILDGYNGRLVPPVDTHLVEAIGQLVQDAELRMQMGKQARQTALAFDKSSWRAAWRRILQTWLEKKR